MKPSTNALLLLLQIDAIASSSLSSLSAAGESPPSGITCADSSSSLQLNECLTAGKAICSSNGSWAFGIDPADQRIKLWHGDQVRFIVACLFCCVHNAGEQKKPKHHYMPTRRRTWSHVHVLCDRTRETKRNRIKDAIVDTSHYNTCSADLLPFSLNFELNSEFTDLIHS